MFGGKLCFFNGLAGVYNGNMWGYIDKQGDIIIDCKYRSINDFSEGLALVMNSSNEMFIDLKGQTVFELGKSCYTSHICNNRFRNGVYVKI